MADADIRLRRKSDGFIATVPAADYSKHRSHYADFEVIPPKVKKSAKGRDPVPSASAPVPVSADT